jgi:pimeloyl-ACP methyl ester carboxylesterase
MHKRRHEIDGPFEGMTFVLDQHGDGSAADVVWLHGEWGALDGVPWDERTTERARVHEVHLPGWGVSTGVERFDSLQQLATAVWWALDRCELDRVLLAGHGIGAALAFELAAQQPQRVLGVVAAAPFGIVLEEEPGADLFGLLARDVLPHLYTDPAGELVARHFPPPADAHEKGLASIRRVEVLGAASRFLFPLPDTDVASRLYRLADVPVELLWGADDGLVPAAVAAEWERHLPRARSTVVDGVAHMLPYECDALGRAVATALEAATQPTGA